MTAASRSPTLPWLIWTEAVTLVMSPLMPETKMDESPKPFEASTCGAQSGIATGVFDVKVFFVVVGAAWTGPANTAPARMTTVMTAVLSLNRLRERDGSRPANIGALVRTYPPSPPTKPWHLG